MLFAQAGHWDTLCTRFEYHLYAIILFFIEYVIGMADLAQRKRVGNNIIQHYFFFFHQLDQLIDEIGTIGGVERTLSSIILSTRISR